MPRVSALSFSVIIVSTVCIIVAVISEKRAEIRFENIGIKKFRDRPEFVYDQFIWLSPRISLQIEEIFPCPIYGPPDDIFE